MPNSPKTNVLIALKNTLERNSSILYPVFRSNGTANAAGDSLEYFVKDMFCTRASQYQSADEKEKIYKQYLSWTGNSKNFPDFIVKNGVGVEPKKMDGLSYSTLALNSSYPKDYIYPDSQNIPKKIEETDDWQQKEVIYVAGNLNKDNNKLISLWFAYGNTFVANRETYLNLIEEIRTAIKETNSTLVNSKELARAVGIDPLNHSNLRVRGMYELQHPQNVFNEYISQENVSEDATKIFLVMLKNDYDHIEDKPDFTSFINSNQLKISEILIPDPNNINEKLEALFFEGWTN